MREQFGKTLTLQPQEIAVTSTDERFLQKALAIVEANMGNNAFDVETFGREIGMSRSQLHRKLSALINQSPSDFIRQLRLQRAAVRRDPTTADRYYALGLAYERTKRWKLAARAYEDAIAREGRRARHVRAR